MRIATVADSLARLQQSGLKFGAVIDVGIQHATPVLIQTFPKLHHHLFEPIAEYTPFIQKNYAAVSYDLTEAAITDFDGTLNLKSEKKTRGDEISHSYIVNKAGQGTREVRALRLDTYFEAKPRPKAPYFLKIDVEGPKVPSQILNGARKVLQDTAVVMIEMTVNTFMERARLLDEMGFDVWDICDLCYYDDCLWQVDVIFVQRTIKADIAALRPMDIKPMRKELWQGSA